MGQRAHVFAAPVRDNIALGRTGVDDEYRIVALVELDDSTHGLKVLR